MKTIALLLLTLMAASAAENGAATDQSACKPGAFKLLNFNGVEARGKADARFNVWFDATNYKSNDFERALRSAMSNWSTVSNSRWRYAFADYTTNPGSFTDGDMTITKGGRSFSTGVLAVTVTSALINTGEILDADIFVNPALPIDINKAPGIGEYDFESIMLHEMGHGLGLDHNDGCYTTDTVMQSTLSPAKQKRSLFPPEMDGARFLYPSSNPSSGGPAPVSVSPSALSFGMAPGGATTASQTLTLALAAGTPWSAAASTSGGENWLSVSPSAGNGPATLTVTASAASLAAALYTGRINVVSGTNSLSVVVSLNVAAVDAAPAALAFSAVVGSTVPAPQTISLTGPIGVPWSAALSTGNGAGWLRVTPASGNLPATLSVSVGMSGLSPNLYTERILVTAGGATRDIAVQFNLTGQPLLIVEPAQISLSSPAGSAMPVCASVGIRGTGTSVIDWRATASTPWLAASPLSGRSPSSLNLCATAGGLAPGNYTSSVNVSSAAPNSPQAVTVSFSVTPSVAIADGGVTNAATFLGNQSLAPGELLSLFGVNLAAQTAFAERFPLPTELADCRVLIGGVPAPLIYVSPGQINLIAPSALANLAGSSTTLVLFNGRLAAPSVRVTVARQAPGVFTALGNGAGAGAVTHADGSLVTRVAPLLPGEAVSVYLTGIGPLDRSVPDGEAAPSDRLARAVNTVRLLLDGREAPILFAGAAPGFAGLQVVIATVPDGIPRRFPEMVVEVQGVSSNRVTAGGPSLSGISPATVRSGADAILTIQGFNLPASSAVRLGSTTLPATALDDQTIQAVVPARLLSTGFLTLQVFDTEAPAEPASNSVTVSVQSGS